MAGVRITDPNNPDTDGDGFNDGVELAAGSDPNSSESKPDLGTTNQSPTNLSAKEPLTVTENSPIGTVVGALPLIRMEMISLFLWLVVRRCG